MCEIFSCWQNFWNLAFVYLEPLSVLICLGIPITEKQRRQCEIQWLLDSPDKAEATKNPEYVSIVTWTYLSLTKEEICVIFICQSCLGVSSLGFTPYCGTGCRAGQWGHCFIICFAALLVILNWWCRLLAFWWCSWCDCWARCFCVSSIHRVAKSARLFPSARGPGSPEWARKWSKNAFSPLAWRRC